MKYEPTGVREGLVAIIFNDRGRLELRGLDVMGYSDEGRLINRKVFISRNAPTWFNRLCFLKANSDFKVRVRIMATYNGNSAYAVPVAASEQEALHEWGLIRSTSDVPIARYEYAVKAHEYCAAKNDLKVVEHQIEDKRIRSLAVNVSGVKVFITGGYILGCLKEKVENGSLDWDTEVNRYIRIRPIS